MEHRTRTIILTMVGEDDTGDADLCYIDNIALRVDIGFGETPLSLEKER